MSGKPHHQNHQNHQNHPSSFSSFSCGQFGRREQPWDRQIPRRDYQHHAHPQPGRYMSRGSYRTNPGGRGGTYHGNTQPYNNTNTNTSPQGVYFADASGIVHTDTEPLQDNPYYNQDVDTSELEYSFQTHTTTTTKRIIMLTRNKMKTIQLLQTSTTTMTQLDMMMDMDTPTSNTLINTLDNH